MEINKTDELKENIIKLIQDQGGGVSFVELCRIPDFTGDREMLINENTILWQGLSSNAIAALNALLDEKKITGTGTSILVYMCDGKMLDLPLAKRPDFSYKKPHWLPMVFNLAKEKSK